MKILALIPPSNIKSPANIYRGQGVLERLDAWIWETETRKAKHDVDIDYFGAEHMKWDWADWMRASKKYDWLFVMRSAHIEHLNPASMAKTFGIKIAYDLDDDYTAIEPDNTAYPAFQQPETIQAYSWFLRNSDLKTFSTQALLDKFGNGHICPNALDDMVFPMDKEYPNPNPNVMTWRGGGSHLQDLLAYKDELNQFMQENSGIKMDFICPFFPWFLKNKNMVQTPYSPDYWNYMSLLQQKKPWGNIVPIQDSLFNRSKSNIAALESVYAGACPIVPNWIEWNQMPAVLTYDNKEQFTKNLNLLTTMSPEEHKERWTANMKWIKENRILSVVNRKRMELLVK